MLTVLTIILTADLLTGIGHWAEDAYCRRGMGGWLGDTICDPNLRHHEDQSSFADGSFWHRNSSTFAIAWPFAILAAIVGCWWVAAVAALASLGNEVHAWSHRRPSHWLPRLLQDLCIVQTPQQHARHHRKPFTACYCTLTNLCNPILDRLHVWHGIEAAIYFVSGIKPQREKNGYHQVS